jgi:hypothetical protein
MFGFFYSTHGKSDEGSQFGSCDLSYLPAESIWEFSVYDNFASTHRDLSALNYFCLTELPIYD